MDTVAVEAEVALNPLLDRIEGGREIAITRHGRVVARLLPVDDTPRLATGSAAAARIRARAMTRKSGSFYWTDWKALRDEGRQ
jgi:antitoxin (DNA-binding transcriptional repressor) of toxin-antitoxin stability system